MSVSRFGREAGIASMIVTLIIMIISSLIVLGFAQSARRNQREALDRQVSSQAYYAAESGVNDAVNQLTTQIANNAVVAKTQCVGGPGGWSTFDATKSTIGTNTRYTCLIVNPSPKNLLYTQVSQGKSTVVPINAATAIASMTITWQANGADSRNPADCDNLATKLPTQTNWDCDYALLRLDLTKYGSDFSANTLAGNTATFFLKPNASGSDVTVPALSNASQRSFTNTINCVQSTSTCTAKLVFTGDQQNRYFMRMTSLYRDASQVTITAVNSTGQTLELTGAQAIIDSTGQSQDQLRRISVRQRLSGANSSDEFPVNALQTAGSICKRFAIGENLAATPANLCQP